MWCKKCGGKVLADRTFDQNVALELYCIGCGKRWMLSRSSNALGRVLNRLERQHVDAVILNG